MRQPNPPKVLLTGLTEDEKVKVIRLALEVVHELGAGREWGALERIEFTHMEPDVYVAFWSLLNSEQRSLIKDLQGIK